MARERIKIKVEPSMNLPEALALKHFYGNLHDLSKVADQVICERVTELVHRYAEEKK